MLQEILGHTSITTTLDLYGHVYPDDIGQCPTTHAMLESRVLKDQPKLLGRKVRTEV